MTTSKYIKGTRGDATGSWCTRLVPHFRVLICLAFFIAGQAHAESFVQAQWDLADQKAADAADELASYQGTMAQELADLKRLRESGAISKAVYTEKNGRLALGWMKRIADYLNASIEVDRGEIEKIRKVQAAESKANSALQKNYEEIRSQREKYQERRQEKVISMLADARIREAFGTLDSGSQATPKFYKFYNDLYKTLGSTEKSLKAKLAKLSESRESAEELVGLIEENINAKRDLANSLASTGEAVAVLVEVGGVPTVHTIHKKVILSQVAAQRNFEGAMVTVDDLLRNITGADAEDEEGIDEEMPYANTTELEEIAKDVLLAN